LTNFSTPSGVGSAKPSFGSRRGFMMLEMSAGTMVGGAATALLLKSNLRWLLIACFVFFSVLG
jgi:hypothetical protein